MAGIIPEQTLMGIKSKPVQFTRAEAEALMNLMHHSGVQATFIGNLGDKEKEAIRTVHSDLPIAARNRTVLALNTKIWEAWADTHPEEGPFK